MSKTTKVGVAWKKETPDNKSYLSVVITNPTGQDFRFTIWPVESKQNENSPDYTVTKSSDASNREALAKAIAAAGSKPSGTDFPAAGQARPGSSQPGDFPADDLPPVSDDEIPF